MKNAILLSFFILTIFSINAQNNDKVNEVKLNGLFLVLGAVEITYERLLNDESGVGISVFLPIDNDVKDDIDYYISPYYRMYFGKKYAAGFFVEGFGMLNSARDDSSFFSSGNKKTDFALGLGFGGKWITKRGFLAELNFGVGRNLFNTKENGNEIIGKGGITIGYRF
ncbi:DUF3575 domain-containing protein [Olleya sp. AH-315-K02]|nr:DUF3575 domain-containing protein [Olleya sp. AH-315-K02]